MESKIAVIGLGYVGLPLAVALAKSYKVVGYDVSEHRIREIKEGYDRTKEIEEAGGECIWEGQKYGGGNGRLKRTK